MEASTSLSTFSLREGSGEYNQTTLRPASSRAEWLVILDHTSAILMTCNTITLMLAMGAATYWREVWHHVKRPWGTLVGMICQFFFLPALAFGLCVAFKLPPYQALGVLILACSPGGAFSTFFTYWVDGDLALSIIMTAVSSLLAFGMMPLNLWAYSRPWTNQELKVPYMNIFISLAFVTVPVILGTIIRHFNRKWANYIAKVCGLLGWAGALTCGIMLILMYWDVIIETSINLVITAALIPIISVIFAYTVSKIVCFNHTFCRTIAVETGCQNIVVATNVMLLSFAEPEIRGQLVIFPVLYGISQLAEVLITVGVFQLWFYFHRNNVVEEEVKSVIDNSILTSVPVPAHRLSEAKIQSMTGFPGTPDICRWQRDRQQQHQAELTTYYRYIDSSRQQEYSMKDEDDACASEQTTLRVDEVDDPNTWKRSVTKLPEARATTQPEKEHSSPYPFYGRPKSPTFFAFPENPYFDSPRSPDFDTESLDFLDDDCDIESQKSPTLSNKGVPNMFPVTQDDFSSSREPSPLPYGSPIPVHKDKFQSLDWITSSITDSPNHTTSSLASPNTPSKAFAFYHNDVRIGQADNFKTFGSKRKTDTC
ncbi:uncharacterized protein [Palaemon carinicauda]|uniref:uncharacterized protein isoform X1 n=1 Tax=Palaemon carinicauda TaxID=392227 RepID=UPI0035B59236